MPSPGAIKAGDAFVRLSTRDELQRGLTRASRRLKAFGAGMQRIGVGMLKITAALAAPAALAVKAASDMEEAMSKFNVVFGASAKAVKAWGDEYAGQVGRSKRQIVEFLASTQDLFVPLGFASDAAEKMSKEVTQLAVDLASFNNKADADTLRDLQAALTGSSEVMKKYGVIVNETAVKQELLNKGLDPSKATIQQKVMARLNIIMAGTAAAQGDAERTAGSFANQMKRLRANLDDAAVSLGTALLPMLTEFVKNLTDITKRAAKWIEQNKAMVIWGARWVAKIAAIGAAFLAVSLIIKVVIRLISMLQTVLKGAVILKSMLVALSGPKGWLIVAAAAAAGAAAWIATSKVIKNAREEMEKLKQGAGQAGGKEWSLQEARKAFIEMRIAQGKTREQAVREADERIRAHRKVSDEQLALGKTVHEKTMDQIHAETRARMQALEEENRERNEYIQRRVNRIWAGIKQEIGRERDAVLGVGTERERKEAYYERLRGLRPNVRRIVEDTLAVSTRGVFNPAALLSLQGTRIDAELRKLTEIEKHTKRTSDVLRRAAAIGLVFD